MYLAKVDASPAGRRRESKENFETQLLHLEFFVRVRLRARASYAISSGLTLFPYEDEEDEGNMILTFNSQSLSKRGENVSNRHQSRFIRTAEKAGKMQDARHKKVRLKGKVLD